MARDCVARDTERYPFFYEWDEGVRKWVKPEQQQLDSLNTHQIDIHIPSPEPDIPPRETINITMPEGVCIYCGQITTDWWSFDGATKECKCNKCKREGKH
jgi:hypothetical protein